MLLQLLAQRIAIDAEHLGGTRLVAAGAQHHLFEYRPLDGKNHHLVNI